MIDYLVCEAVAVKATKEDEAAAEEARKAEWKNDTSALREKLARGD